jgi:hypothetical protein
MTASGTRAYSCFPVTFEVDSLNHFAKLICAPSHVTRRDIHSWLPPKPKMDRMCGPLVCGT